MDKKQLTTTHIVLIIIVAITAAIILISIFSKDISSNMDTTKTRSCCTNFGGVWSEDECVGLTDRKEYNHCVTK